jgi:predicted extracellular nuclease
MATLFVTEYSGAARGGEIQVAHGRRLRRNNVTIGASSTPSAAFGTYCGLVRIATDTNCSFVFSQDDGVSPTATNADQYLPAGSVEYFTAKPGDFIAVIQNP